MLPKINNEQQKRPSDSSAGDVSKEEIRAENRDSFVQQLGNEGMNNILNSSFDPNMLKIANEDNMIDYEDRPIEEDEKIDIKNDDAGSDSEDDDDSENENIISAKPKNSDRKKNEDAKAIIQEKDPLKIIEKAPVDLLNEAMDEIEESNPELDRSMVVEAPKRKKKKSGEPAEKEEVEDDMKPAAGFPFQPVKIPKRKKAHGGDRFLTGLAQYSGQTVGKAVAVVLNALYWTLAYLPIQAYKFFRGKKNKPRVKPEEFEEFRRHDLIQGWDGRKIPGTSQGGTCRE